METTVKTGLKLCEDYFEEYGRPMLERDFSEYLGFISCGLVGEGSECLGYDDSLSKDHDFGPGFCIWVDDDKYEEIGEKLKRAYEKLPDEFRGIKRYNTENAKGRVGVITYGDFFERIIGRRTLPVKPYEWNAIPDAKLGLLINGKIFMDVSGKADRCRKKIKYERPFSDRLAKLASQLEVVAQSGQYNYYRSVARNAIVTEKLVIASFMESSMRTWHLLCDSYAPYDKWLCRSLIDLPGGSELRNLMMELAVSEHAGDRIADICALIRKTLVVKGFCNEEKEYLADMAADVMDYAKKAMVADDITELEFALFDKTGSEGGRAVCQDDWGTFSKMRRSQYYSFPVDLLCAVASDFKKACEEGRNVITEKYGIMMQSTDPAGYEKIKDKLPCPDEEFVKLREAIIPIQVGMMEEFAKEYPKMAQNARVIHTKDDSILFTSYETYLRGELTTYSFSTLVLYGRFLAGLAKEGKNLAKIIMTKSVHLYGYDTLEKAENSI
jgi:hypothetical protein